MKNRNFMKKINKQFEQGISFVPGIEKGVGCIRLVCMWMQIKLIYFLLLS